MPFYFIRKFVFPRGIKIFQAIVSDWTSNLWKVPLEKPSHGESEFTDLYFFETGRPKGPILSDFVGFFKLICLIL